MNKSKRKTSTIGSTIVLTIGLTIISFIMLLSTINTTKAATSIKVGFFEIDGYFEKQGDNIYSGYGYEYLQMISQYTNWNYEYVTCKSMNECYEKLEAGEIDILSPAIAIRDYEKRFDFSEVSIGNSYTTLFVNENNDTYAYEDFSKFSTMSIGVVQNTFFIESLDEYAKANDFTPFISSTYLSEAALINAVKSGNVASGVLSSLLRIDGVKIVAKFNPQPFYFATRKIENGQKNTLLVKLNSALSSIKTIDPYIDIRLHNEFYGDSEYSSITLTSFEKEYIENVGEIEVVYDASFAPIEYYNEETKEFDGITADLFELISEKTGLKFRYTPANNYVETLKYVKEGKAQIVSYINSDFNQAINNNVKITSTILSPTIVKVYKKANVTKDKELITYIPNSTYIADFVKSQDYLETVECQTIEECFDAVLDSRVDACYVNGYVASYMLLEKKYSTLFSQSIQGQSDKMSIGVSKNANEYLFSILNKVSSSISAQQIDIFVTQNIVAEHKYNVTDFFYDNPIQVVTIIIIASITIIGIIILFNYIRKRNDKKMYQVTNFDEQTGIWNLSKFKIEAQKIIMSFSRADYCIVVTSIVGFKMYENFYGYQRGLEVIKTFASHVQKALHHEELFGRINDDIFILLLRHTNKQEFEERLRTAEEAIKESRNNTGENFNIEIKSGICPITIVDRDITTIVNKAIFMNNHVKENPKKKIDYYDDEIIGQIAREKELEDSVEYAIANNEFIPYFQPKVDVTTGEIIGAEALVRWNHHIRGLLQPGSFISLFDKNGKIVAVDLFIFEAVCKILEEYHSKTNEYVAIACNFSKLHLGNEEFPNQLQSIASKHSIPPAYLEIEITETVAIDNMELANEQINKIKKMGFLVAIDDFGTGYSSLNILQNLSVDVLKLDKTVIDKCLDSQLNRDVLSGLIEAANKNNITVICEGIETKLHEQEIIHMGCRYAQGYMYYKPMAPEAFIELLNKDNIKIKH